MTTWRIILPVLLSSVIRAANILVVLPLPAPSHFHCFYPLVEQLQQRGHNMTVVTPVNFVNERVNHLDLAGVQKHFLSSWTTMRHKYRFTMMLSMFEVAQSFARGSLTHANFQKLIRTNDTHFDMVMVELYYMDAYLALGRKFRAPVVALVPQTLPTALAWISTNPIQFSYVPVMYLPFTNRMSFWQRSINTVFGLAHSLTYELSCLGYNQQIVDREFHFLNDSQRDVRSMVNDIAITLVNSHHTLGYPRPYLPNIVEVGGIHLRKPKPLPQDLQNFMDKANPDGVVYISFGTMVDPAVVNDWTKVIIEVFKKLPVSVMWKWKPELLHAMPDNFLVNEWFPQNDVLNHPNCKLFITHGGIHSIIESINAAVPILGLPFFSEQSYNVKMMENLGVGIMLTDIEKQELEMAVDKVLNDSSFQAKMNARSQLFKDRPADPLTTAVFWVEHVLRNKGGSHMKSSALELTWYQYYLLDVYSFLLTILVCVFYAINLASRRLATIIRQKDESLIRVRNGSQYSIDAKKIN